MKSYVQIKIENMCECSLKYKLTLRPIEINYNHNLQVIHRLI
jgi:hypothetical protein